LTQREYPVVLPNDPEKSEADRQKYLSKQDTLQGGLESGLIYSMTNRYSVPYSDAFSMLTADINRIFQEAIVKAITGELTPEQAVEMYRDQMRAIGAQQVLDEANEYLGVSSTLEY
jgi:maltose-binding protein MalE